MVIGVHPDVSGHCRSAPAHLMTAHLNEDATDKPFNFIKESIAPLISRQAKL